jgi:hypothetical protein
MAREMFQQRSVARFAPRNQSPLVQEVQEAQAFKAKKA